jgi:hypothetical protein
VQQVLCWVTRLASLSRSCTMLQQVAKRSLGLLARAGTRSFAAEAAPAAVASDIGYVSQVRPLATSTTQICSSGTTAVLGACFANVKQCAIASVWAQKGVHSLAARVLVLLPVLRTERGDSAVKSCGNCD